MLDVYLLGEGGTMPLPGRWLSSVLVRHQGRLLLFDCGEATQIPLRSAGWGLRAVDAVFLSHFHADHVSGLPGLLLTLGNAERREPLHVYGPAGLQRVVNSLRVIAPALPYALEYHELVGGEAISVGDIRGACLAVEHSLPCLSYTLEVPRGRPFLPERARALGIPPPLWGRLQAGQNVPWAGREVTPEEVLGPTRPGVKFAYVTDTRPTSALPGFVAGAQLLVCEGMYGATEDLHRVIETRHMLFAEAATIAKTARVDALWLTHFSPALVDPAAHLPVARAVFPNTQLGYSGLTTTLHFPGD